MNCTVLKKRSFSFAFAKTNLYIGRRVMASPFRAGVAAVTAGVLLVVCAVLSGGIQGWQDDAHARKGGESLLAVDEKAVGL